MIGLPKSFANRLNKLTEESLHLLCAKKEKFVCPVCQYEGAFLDIDDPSGLREHAMCPGCGSLERHRVLWLTLKALSRSHPFCEMRLLHFAPEPQFETLLREMFKSYTTADLYARRVDIKADLRNLPFGAASFEIVIASHVLEHIKEDIDALKSIRRVLTPKGLALLQIPVFGKTTVEYAEPNSFEWGHVRAPGEDYFDRYLTVFEAVETFHSSQFQPKYQPFIYEDRSAWPKAFSLRPTSPGRRHEDIVPVCYA